MSQPLPASNCHSLWGPCFWTQDRCGVLQSAACTCTLQGDSRMRPQHSHLPSAWFPGPWQRSRRSRAPSALQCADPPARSMFIPQNQQAHHGHQKVLCRSFVLMTWAVSLARAWPALQCAGPHACSICQRAVLFNRVAHASHQLSKLAPCRSQAIASWIFTGDRGDHKRRAVMISRRLHVRSVASTGCGAKTGRLTWST